NPRGDRDGLPGNEREERVDHRDAEDQRVRPPRVGDEVDERVEHDCIVAAMIGAVKHQPLAGMRVLDVATSSAGPYCARILSALGADVVKVERPDTGDDGRAWGP